MGIVSEIVGHAQRWPDKLALEDEAGVLSYAELARRSASLAAYLREMGVAHGDRVAIHLENSRDHVLSILACLRAGAVWVPINFTLSPEKLRVIADGFTPKVVIAGHAQLPRLSEIYQPGLPILVCDSGNSQLAPGMTAIEAVYARAAGPLDDLPDEERLAYIIYTSGSTGAPKGVAVSLASLSNYVRATCDDLGFHEGTRTLSVTPYYFDAPLGSIFCTLVRGGTLCIFPRLLFPRLIARKVVEHGITYIGTTPGLFRILIDALQSRPGASLALEVVGVGGDITSKDDLLTFMELCPNVKVFNRYGPTETTSVSSGFRITSASLRSTEPIPIGKPLRGVTYYLFDEAGQLLQGPGKLGELYIGGVQVMRGYFGDPALTAQVLRDDLVAGDRVYRTGDVCSRNEVGEYVFHNRVGGLLKRRGIRIYLSEIDLAIEACRNVKACVSLSFVDALGRDSVVAFVLPLHAPLARDELVAELSSKHPPHVVPNDVQALETFPYTTVGKIDRAALLSSYSANEPRAREVGVLEPTP